MRGAAVAACAAVVIASRGGAQVVVPGPLVAGEVTFLFHSTFVGRLEGHAPIERAEFTGGQLGDVRGVNAALDQVYDTVKDDETYKPDRFQAALAALGARVKGAR